MQMTTGLVSVIIVNFNGDAYLSSCLNALAGQRHASLEIIIIDNASGDNSFQKIDAFRTQHPDMDVQLLANPENAGFCRGNNQGIALSSGEFVLALNADVTLDPGYIAELVEVMRSDSGLGFAIGKLLSGDASQKLDSCGIRLYKTRRAADRGQREDAEGRYEQREEVFGASGAASLYRRSMLEELKYPPHEYFDELFFAYKEDVDLSWRAHLHGWRCMYVPEASALHFRNWGSGTRSRIPRRVRRHSLKNRYIMLLKNERVDTIFSGIFQLVGYEAASIAYILFREPFLLKAFWMLVRCLPEILHKRAVTQAGVTAKDARENILPWLR